MDDSLKRRVLEAVHESDVVDLCRELVRIPSFSGEEQRVARTLASRFEAAGMQTRIDDHGNVIAVLEGAQPGGPKLLLNGHMDVAPVGRAELWERDPFAGVIEDGVLYGRGACDMKAALAAMTVAGESLAAMRGSLGGELIFVFVTKEERGNGTRYVLKDKTLAPDFAIVGEATDMDISLGQRYGSLVELTTSGRSVHFQHYPQQGVDAVGSMMDLLHAIRDMEFPHDPRLGETTWGLTTIEAEPNQFGLINDACRVRMLVNLSEMGETLDGPGERLVARIRAVVGDLSRKDPRLVAEVKEIDHLESFYTSPDDETARPLIASLCRNIEARTHRTPGFTTWTFGTDAAFFSRYFGAATVGFGPGVEFDAHLPVDRVELSHLVQATEVYALTAADLLGAGSSAEASRA